MDGVFGKRALTADPQRAGERDTDVTVIQLPEGKLIAIDGDELHQLLVRDPRQRSGGRWQAQALLASDPSTQFDNRTHSTNAYRRS